jgi:DNA repair ATPase RecN
MLELMPNKDRAISIKELEALKQELLEKLASKLESERLATKHALKMLATKEELRKLDEKTDRLLGVVFEVKEQMVTRDEVEQKFNLILNAIDQLSLKVDNLSIEKSSIDHGLTRHENRLDDHEQRIVELESVK